MWEVLAVSMFVVAGAIRSGLTRWTKMDHCSAVAFGSALDYLPVAALLLLVALRSPPMRRAMRLDGRAIIGGFLLVAADLYTSSLILGQPMSGIQDYTAWADALRRLPLPAFAVTMEMATNAVCEEVTRVYLIEGLGNRFTGAAVSLALSLLMHLYLPFQEWLVVATAMAMYTVAYLALPRWFMLFGAHLLYNLLVDFGPCVDS